MANLETTLAHELSNLHVANNAQHQSTLASIAELCNALAAAQQQLALLATAPPPAMVPVPAHAAQPPAPANQTPWTTQYRRGRGNGRRMGRNTYSAPPPIGAASAVAGIPTPNYTPTNRRSVPNPTNGTITTTTATPVGTTCPSGTPAPHAMTANRIIRKDAHAPMLGPTKPPVTTSATEMSTKPSCPATHHQDKLDEEGRRM